MKSYKKQSILSASMRGSRIEIAKLIMSYNYTADNMDLLETSRTNKDIYLNTALHYSYLNESVEFKEVLKDNNATNLAIMNRRGKNAKDFSHYMKWDSDDEEAPDGEDEV